MLGVFGIEVVEGLELGFGVFEGFFGTADIYLAGALGGVCEHRDDIAGDFEKAAGDGVLFYHSATKMPAIVGTAVIVREAYPDDTAWSPDSKYFDPKSSPENPRWVMVDIRFEKEFAEPLGLAELRENPKLKDMMLLRKGMRLSIQPVTRQEFEAVLAMARC